MRTKLSVALILVASILAFIIGRATSPAPMVMPPAAGPARKTIWTCSMHSQIRLPNPGNCPICNMLLIPIPDDPAPTAGGAPAMQLSDAAIAMAGIETAPVERRALFNEIRAVGLVEPNETALATVTSRVEGWVEKLFVDATGVPVAKGDHLLELYSPELISDQRELLIAIRTDASPDVLKAGRSRLERWGMESDAIELMLKTKQVLETVTFHAPATGTVLEKNVVKGAHVNRGDVLYRLADLGSVWVHLDIYERDMAWVQPGEDVEVVAEAWPGKVFAGTVTFVSPVLDEATRSVRVRVALPNPDGRLKPGMFVSAALRVRLLETGDAAPTARAGKWTCPMHPEVIEEAAGKCPKCGMALVQFPGKSGVVGNVLAMPATALLDSGVRRLAYVDRGAGRFEQREVVVGPRAGDWVPILSGLAEGERVATRGGFLIDSQFQIRGLPSLIMPGGGAAMAPHEHGGSKQESGHQGMGH